MRPDGDQIPLMEGETDDNLGEMSCWLDWNLAPKWFSRGLCVSWLVVVMEVVMAAC